MGFGTTPFGTGPVGRDADTTTSTPRTLPLTDALGISRGSRLLDAKTGDYDYSEGQALGEDNLRHRVRLAMMTELGSAIDGTLGIAPPGGVISPGVIAKLVQDVKDALKRMVDEKVLEIISVNVDISVRPVKRTVQWRDLRTNDIGELTV